MLRRELVDEERWVDSGRFNRLLAVYQVLPGPEAHELAVHLGMLRGGRIGGLLAGLGFMLPGFVLMLGLSWLYFQIDLTQAAVGAAFLGVQVAVIALIVRAVQRIGQHILVSPGLWLVAIAAGVATLAGVLFWVTLPLAGLAHVIAGRSGRRSIYLLAAAAAVLALAWSVAANGLPAAFGQVAGAPSSTGPAPAAGDASVVDLLVSGLKAGLLTFGGAYTAIPFVRGDAVGNGWLTDAQFLDGLALSGVLPAPLIIFSTFVGYVAGGPLGAVAMTAGIFLPAFSFSLLFRERLEAVVENPGLHRFLEGVAAGVIGLIAVTAFELALVVAARLPSLPIGALIFAAALAVLIIARSRAAVPAVLAAAAVAGWLAFAVLSR